MEDGGRRMEDGGWGMEDGGRRMGDGGRRTEDDGWGIIYRLPPKNECPSRDVGPLDLFQGVEFRVWSS
jgi:hypothetical protein